jgi:hypothetical protein
MKRNPGGYIGFRPVPAPMALNSAASGLWTVREAEALKRAGIWPTTRDPLFSSVSLLLFMDGTGNAFVDSSPLPKTITAGGTATQSATQSKFGGKSGVFDGNSHLAASAVDLSLSGLSEFTVEGWYYFTDGSRNAVEIMFCNYDTFSTSTSLFFGKHAAFGGRVAVFASSGSALCSESTTPPSNEWVHYALVFSGGVMKVYRNGNETASGATSPTLSGNLVRVGGNNESGGVYGFRGNIDEFRITKVARYTENFTPPTASFPDSA